MNGLVIGQGEYLDSKGQPSSFSVIQSQKYNNYTYQITVEKEIAKYRNALLGLLHPAGTNVVGRYKMENQDTYRYTSVEALSTGLPLYHYVPGYGATVNMQTDFESYSTNTVSFSINSANLANIITYTGNTTIEIMTANGPNVKSIVTSVNPSTNTITIQDQILLTFQNVAYGSANSATNVINITGLTGNYDIVNNGNYSNTQNPLFDMVFAGDELTVSSVEGLNLLSESGNTVFTEDGTNIFIEPKLYTVTAVDYVNGLLYISPSISAFSNNLITIKRTFGPTSCVTIYGPVGIQYIADITTEDGNTLTTEDGKLLILG